MKNSLSSWQIYMLCLALLGACRQDGPETTLKPEAPPADFGTLPTMTRTPSSAGASVFFITPRDGATVSSPVHLEFGLSEMELAPAGENRPNSGHHHIIIDDDLPTLDLPVPADDQHVHFGDARSQTELGLAPGPHVLQLLFADHLHIPHDPPLFSERIRITVE